MLKEVGVVVEPEPVLPVPDVPVVEVVGGVAVPQTEVRDVSISPQNL